MKTTDIKTKIAEKISGASEQVSNSVIDEMANIEIARRTNMVTESVKLIEKLERNLANLEVADVVTYGKDGEKSEAYSESRFNSIKEMKKSIAKVYEASDNALSKNNEEVFLELEKLIGEFSYKH